MADLFSGASAQSTPSVFNFGTNAVRIVVRDGEPWFVAADVAAALGYRDAQDAGRSLKPEQKGTQNVRTPGGDQRVTIINESGLYRLVLRSRKPEAEKFSDWVTGEVLPSIRKTGGYAKPAADEERIKLAFALAAQAAANVERTVFDAVMAGESEWWNHNRYLLTFSYDRDGKPTLPCAKAIGIDQLVISMDALPEHITGPDSFDTNDVQLANLARACSEMLGQRAKRRAQQRADKEVARPGAVLFQQTAPGRLERVTNG